ncbi:hypothetical protein D3C78_1364480 [compost metagenome]
MLQQVITRLSLDQFLTLCGISAVITARHAGIGAPSTSGHSLELTVAKAFQKGVGPIAFDHADVFAGQQAVEHHARTDGNAAGADALTIHGRRCGVVVRRPFLDVHGQRRADAGGDPFAFLVILDVCQANQHGM